MISLLFPNMQLNNVGFVNNWRLKYTFLGSLQSFVKFLKHTDAGKNVTIHNRKKRHNEVTKELWLSFDTSARFLG